MVILLPKTIKPSTALVEIVLLVPYTKLLSPESELLLPTIVLALPDKELLTPDITLPVPKSISLSQPAKTMLLLLPAHILLLQPPITVLHSAATTFSRPPKTDE